MWEHRADFSPRSQEIIGQHVPETSRLETIDRRRLVDEQPGWVLKSDYGAEGEEVLLGCHTHRRSLALRPSSTRVRGGGIRPALLQGPGGRAGGRSSTTACTWSLVRPPAYTPGCRRGRRTIGRCRRRSSWWGDPSSRGPLTQTGASPTTSSRSHSSIQMAPVTATHAIFAEAPGDPHGNERGAMGSLSPVAALPLRVRHPRAAHHPLRQQLRPPPRPLLRSPGAPPRCARRA